ncbi:MAG TPA: hypothetical protein VHE79_01225, partial [Spirochaetia bacterium]
YMGISKDACVIRDIAPPPWERRREILASAESYLSFLLEGFDPSCVDADLEAQAWRYVKDPPAMKELIIRHLREMWESHLAGEWARVRAMLSKSVAAFQRANIAGMGRHEAVRFVTGRDVPDASWWDMIGTAEQLVFAPSAHVGPYLGKWRQGGKLVILFGARMPEGSPAVAPDLSRVELLFRLDALADDHRLHILRLAAETVELRATDVMSALDISQSAASRSLTQLTATGYLVETRRDGAKVYTLDAGRIRDSLGAVARFLGLGAEGTTRTAFREGEPS